VLGVVLAGMLLAGRPCAFALNPTLDSQCAHTAWKVREGVTKGAIHSIAQPSEETKVPAKSPPLRELRGRRRGT
jgi:hypothetical protein